MEMVQFKQDEEDTVSSPITNSVSLCFMLFSWIWQLLLDYLSPDRSLWSSELAKKRSQYKQFKEELLMNPVSPFWWFDTPTLYWLVCEESYTIGL